MDQNQDIDSDLQKAIDDITNNNEPSEPVFDDPVAAPSTVPDNNSVAASVGPFEETPIDTTGASLDEVPELGIPPMPADNDAMTPMPSYTPADPVAAESHGDTDIRGEALRELIPLLDKMDNITAEEKFDLCKMAFEDFHDPAMLEQAFKAAKEIADENSRGQALLYVVKAR